MKHKFLTDISDDAREDNLKLISVLIDLPFAKWRKFCFKS